MKKFVLSVLALLTCSIIFAADLDTYKATYQKEMEAIILEHGMNISKLNESYKNSLDDLKQKVTKAGDLKSVRSIMAETERFTSDKTVTANNTEGSFPDLNTLQTAYIKQASNLELFKATDILSLTAKYDTALENLQKDLTRQNEIDNATKVFEEREGLKQNPTFNAAKEMAAKQTEAQPVNKPDKVLAKQPEPPKTNKPTTSNKDKSVTIDDEAGDFLNSNLQIKGLDIRQVVITRKRKDTLEISIACDENIPDNPKSYTMLIIKIDLDQDASTGQSMAGLGSDINVRLYYHIPGKRWVGIIDKVSPITSEKDFMVKNCRIKDKKATIEIQSKFLETVNSFNFIALTHTQSTDIDVAPNTGYHEFGTDKEE